MYRTLAVVCKYLGYLYTPLTHVPELFIKNDKWGYCTSECRSGGNIWRYYPICNFVEDLNAIELCLLQNLYMDSTLGMSLYGAIVENPV